MVWWWDVTPVGAACAQQARRLAGAVALRHTKLPINPPSLFSHVEGSELSFVSLLWRVMMVCSRYVCPPTVAVFGAGLWRREDGRLIGASSRPGRAILTPPRRLLPARDGVRLNI